ncbi:four helix bundle protein [Flavobacterium haoranii]|uniref:Four helix bundle protein n=1 Tax=Flavobacterium haoranii TaxID=683124 RepID=A0A1M6E949_9FLAO|nr:four helix bundle protein [Flavobacterium haoranii]SHI81975.1 four helix bundle protein [Flavobacterium haoranii]
MNFTNSEKYKNNPVLKESFEFALMIVKYSELLDENKKFVILRQIVRSGTSIGANIKEAQNAESKADFIHKLKIALKEADETEYWLFLCENLENYPNPIGLLEKLNSILKMLNKIISTSKKQFAKTLIN